MTSEKAKRKFLNAARLGKIPFAIRIGGLPVRLCLLFCVPTTALESLEGSSLAGPDRTDVGILEPLGQRQQ